MTNPIICIAILLTDLAARAAGALVPSPEPPTDPNAVIAAAQLIVVGHITVDDNAPLFTPAVGDPYDLWAVVTVERVLAGTMDDGATSFRIMGLRPRTRSRGAWVQQIDPDASVMLFLGKSTLDGTLAVQDSAIVLSRPIMRLPPASSPTGRVAQELLQVMVAPEAKRAEETIVIPASEFDSGIRNDLNVGRLKDDETQSLARSLDAMVKQHDTRSQIAAIEVQLWHDDWTNFPKLVPLLLNPPPADYEAARSAASALDLGFHPTPHASLSGLLALAQTSDRWIRSDAMQALRSIGSDDVVGSMSDIALHNPVESIRNDALVWLEPEAGLCTSGYSEECIAAVKAWIEAGRPQSVCAGSEPAAARPGASDR